jgi:hypothetical protein
MASFRVKTADDKPVNIEAETVDHGASDVLSFFATEDGEQVLVGQFQEWTWWLKTSDD